MAAKGEGTRRGLRIQVPLAPEHCVSVGPWASPSKVSVLFYKVDTELLPSFPPKAAVKIQGGSTVLCNDLPVRKNPFIPHLLSIHFVSQADHNT